MLTAKENSLKFIDCELQVAENKCEGKREKGGASTKAERSWKLNNETHLGPKCDSTHSMPENDLTVSVTALTTLPLGSPWYELLDGKGGEAKPFPSCCPPRLLPWLGQAFLRDLAPAPTTLFGQPGLGEQARGNAILAVFPHSTHPPGFPAGRRHTNEVPPTLVLTVPCPFGILGIARVSTCRPVSNCPTVQQSNSSRRAGRSAPRVAPSGFQTTAGGVRQPPPAIQVVTLQEL
jgi:hypothetical protein